MEEFFAKAGGNLSLEVWADNYVEIFIDGSSVFTPTVDEMFRAGTQAVIDHDFAGTGQHTVAFDVYQSGTNETPPGNPFGLLYAGNLTVPEPSILALLGIGLAGMGFARKKVKV